MSGCCVHVSFIRYWTVYSVLLFLLPPFFGCIDVPSHCTKWQECLMLFFRRLVTVCWNIEKRHSHHVPKCSMKHPNVTPTFKVPLLSLLSACKWKILLCLCLWPLWIVLKPWLLSHCDSDRSALIIKFSCVSTCFQWQQTDSWNVCKFL